MHQRLQQCRPAVLEIHILEGIQEIHIMHLVVQQQEILTLVLVFVQAPSKDAGIKNNSFFFFRKELFYTLHDYIAVAQVMVFSLTSLNVVFGFLSAVHEHEVDVLFLKP